MQLWTILTLSWFAFSFGMAPASAQESKASLLLQFSGLKYAKTDSTAKNAVSELEVENTSTLSGDLSDAHIWVALDRFNLYLYPFKDSNAFVSAGYMVSTDLELGIDFGLNSIEVDTPKRKVDASIYGVFGTYYLRLAQWTLESTLLFDLTKREEITSDPNGIETKISAKGHFIKAAVVGAYPLAQNAWYIAGLAYSQQKTDEGNSQELNSKQLALTLAGLRISL